MTYREEFTRQLRRLLDKDPKIKENPERVAESIKNLKKDFKRKYGIEIEEEFYNINEDRQVWDDPKMSSYFDERYKLGYDNLDWNHDDDQFPYERGYSDEL